jgi:hypothetical protein
MNARHLALSLVRSAQIIVGCLLVGAGWLKAKQPADFLRDMYGYGLVAPPYAAVVASVLPVAEMTAGVAVVCSGRLAFRVPAASLCAVFLVAQASVIARGMTANCGSGIVPGEQVGVATVVRAAVLLTALLLPARRGAAMASEPFSATA